MMMARLFNKSKNVQLAAKVIEAKSFLERSRGLLGRSDFSRNDTMWIHRCNSIHTCFMKFNIDAIFVNKELRVKAIYQNLKPWRLTRLIFTANSVFEFRGGSLDDSKVSVGDQLDVDA